MTHVGIVTGAVRGISTACATCMAKTVDVLVLVDLDPGATADAVDELAARSGTRCEAMAADISDPASVADIARVVAGHGMLHRVAHAAGISPTMASWDRMISVDLVGTALLVDALRPLATAGTAIVCVASMAAQLISGQVDPTVDRIIDDPPVPRPPRGLPGRPRFGGGRSGHGLLVGQAQGSSPRRAGSGGARIGQCADPLGITGHHRHPYGTPGVSSSSRPCASSSGSRPSAVRGRPKRSPPSSTSSCPTWPAS